MTLEELQAKYDALVQEKKDDAEANKTAMSELSEKLRKAKDDGAAKDRQLKKFSDVDLEKVATLETRLAEFEGLDEDVIEKARKLNSISKTKEDLELLEREGLDGLVQAKLAPRLSALEGTIQELGQKNEEQAATIANLKQGNKDRDLRELAFAAIAKSNKFLPGTGDYLLITIKEHAQYTDDNGALYFVDKDGSTYNSKTSPGELMPIEEFVDEVLPQLAAALVRPSKGSNSNGNPDAGPDKGKANPFKNGPLMARTKLLKENPELATRYAKEAAAEGYQLKIKVPGVN